VRRRDFMKVMAGSATAWPLAARAQQPMSVIGFLDSGSPANMEENLAGFRHGLGETAFAEGKNVTIEYRWAQGHNDQLPALAAELVRRPVSVIAATRTSAPALAAKAATATIPIVFQTGSDPVKDGLVASFNRPGGNITGATRQTVEMTPKRLGLIHELAPKATAIGLLVNPKGLQSAVQVQEMQDATRARGMILHVAKASTVGQLDEAIAAVVQSGVAMLIEGNDPLFIDQRKHIVALTNSHKIPTIFFERGAVVDGGLMGYSANFADSFRQVGAYVGRILKGEKPADLPYCSRPSSNW
jgi:putative tryptophan/tyrosine transport system substrate-binding protein